MLLKIFGVITQFSLSNVLFIGLLGLINRFTGNKIFTSIFLAYPANKKIVRRFSFEWAQPFFKLRPAVIGFFLVNKQLTLVLSIGAIEKEIFAFTKSELELLDQRLERIQKLLGAQTRTMAGILPSKMIRSGAIKESTSRESTLKIVAQIVRKIIADEKIDLQAPIVIVGSAGLIGSGLREDLGKSFKIIGLEINDNLQERLSQIQGKHLVINVASYKAWKSIIAGLTEQAIVLNEVYPPPHGEVRKALHARGSVYHVSGVRTQLSFPSLGEGYDKVMPCCAATGDPNLWDVVVVKI